MFGIHDFPIFLLSALIASLNSPLFSPASNAPASVPSSFAGKSIDCFVMGIFGCNADRSPDASNFASNFLCALAAFLRIFFDLAIRGFYISLLVF